MDNTSDQKKALPKKKFQIEEDLLSRFKRLKFKLHTLKLKTKHSESIENLKIPRINNNSKRIANNLRRNGLYSPERLQKTQFILKNSRFMPKNIKISLYDISTLNGKSARFSESLQKSHVSISSPRSESLGFYPSLIKPSKRNREKLPQDIFLRNKLLFSLRKQTNDRGFLNEPEEPPVLGLDIHSRSSQWLLKKDQKIQETRQRLEKSQSLNCTFKPFLIKKWKKSLSKSRNSSNQSLKTYQKLGSKKKSPRENVSDCKSNEFQRLSRRDTSAVTSPRMIQKCSSDSLLNTYVTMTPIKMSIAYKHGFSLKLKSNAKPMLDYKMVNLKS